MKKSMGLLTSYIWPWYVNFKWLSKSKSEQAYVALSAFADIVVLRKRQIKDLCAQCIHADARFNLSQQKGMYRPQQCGKYF